MAMKASSKKVIRYLQEHAGEDLTAQDVANALGMEKRSIVGVFNAAIQRKKLGHYVNAEVELEDGTHKPIKLLVLNDEGLAYDPDASDTEAV